jgi:hypothetical protein
MRNPIRNMFTPSATWSRRCHWNGRFLSSLTHAGWDSEIFYSWNIDMPWVVLRLAWFENDHASSDGRVFFYELIDCENLRLISLNLEWWEKYCCFLYDVQTATLSVVLYGLSVKLVRTLLCNVSYPIFLFVNFRKLEYTYSLMEITKKVGKE